MNEIIILFIYAILPIVSIILFIATLIVNRNTKDIVRQCNMDLYEVYGVMKDIHDRLKAEDYSENDTVKIEDSIFYAPYELKLKDIPTLINGSYTEKLGDKYIKATIDENIN